MTIETTGAAQPDQNSAKVGKGFTVNGAHLALADGTPTARQILVEAGFTPADECVLVQVVGKATQAIGLDETVHLGAPGEEAFYAFRSDRIFRFTLEELGCDWGAKTIDEPALGLIAGIDEDHVIVLERDGRDHELGSDETVELDHRGTEHFRVKRGYVLVTYDGDEVRVHRGRYTTEELIAFFKVQAGYLLNVIDEHSILVPLKPGEVIRVKNSMHFVSQPPGGGSS
jgi:hypothetical protein